MRKERIIMQIYHVSPVEIMKIEKNQGYYRDCLFFSEYPTFHMGGTIVYSMEIDEDEDVIEAYELNSVDVIDNIVDELEYHDITITKEQAKSLLQNRAQIWDMLSEQLIDDEIDTDVLSEMDCYIQGSRGVAAVEMGYLGCLDMDESQHIYIMPMFGKDDLLTLVN